MLYTQHTIYPTTEAANAALAQVCADFEGDGYFVRVVPNPRGPSAILELADPDGKHVMFL